MGELGSIGLIWVMYTSLKTECPEVNGIRVILYLCLGCDEKNS